MYDDILYKHVRAWMKLSRMEIQADRPAIVICYINVHDNEAFSLILSIRYIHDTGHHIRNHYIIGLLHPIWRPTEMFLMPFPD